MRARTLSFTTLAAAVLVMAAWASPKPFTFESDGKIWVEGTSTVRAWTCEAGQFTGAVTGEVQDGMLTSLSATTVTIPLARMDCGGNQITSKMRDAMSAGSHPNIQFTLRAADIAAPSNGRFAVQTSGRLTIAGQTRDVRFTTTGQVLADGRYRLTGSVPITMTQFGIDPPTAMLGTLRSGDDVTVRFDVTIRG